MTQMLVKSNIVPFFKDYLYVCTIKIKKDPNYDFKEAGNATKKPYFFARQANIRPKQL